MEYLRLLPGCKLWELRRKSVDSFGILHPVDLTLSMFDAISDPEAVVSFVIASWLRASNLWCHRTITRISFCSDQVGTSRVASIFNNEQNLKHQSSLAWQHYFVWKTAQHSAP